MSEPFEHMYFNWLCAKIIRTNGSTPSLTHWTLLRTLHNTEFVWQMLGDDNRAADGLELRREFLLAGDFPDNPEWRSYGCSVLEMLIAFSRRAAFQTSTPDKDWFWEFLDNLGIGDLTDATNPDEAYIAEILDIFIWRTYDYNGSGSMFPIENPRHDQRDIEVWYQFCDYLVDQDRLP